jgi:uncharacterized membrane protein
MLREKIFPHHAPDGFRWRGGEIARVEGLSDAVFAFAVTLLIVSLEVPKTFNELMVLMHGFVAFAICFALLMQVWHEQFVFFRRYNLQDRTTIALNLALLFVVLFYVYPLKLLFSVLTNVWMGASLEVRLPSGAVEPMVERHQMPALTAIFSAGYLAVSAVFLLLFWRAYRRRAELELNDLEVLDTRISLGASMLNAGVGLASLLVSLCGGEQWAPRAGVVYPLLLCPGFTVYYNIMGRKKRRMHEAGHASSPQIPDSV